MLLVLPKVIGAVLKVVAQVKTAVDEQSSGGKLITFSEWADIIGVASAELAGLLTEIFASKLSPEAKTIAS